MGAGSGRRIGAGCKIRIGATGNVG